ncbi:MAG: hypothetical protein Q9227_007347 [Pyrenula ochraceoflavens]
MAATFAVEAARHMYEYYEKGGEGIPQQTEIVINPERGLDKKGHTVRIHWVARQIRERREKITFGHDGVILGEVQQETSEGLRGADRIVDK